MDKIGIIGLGYVGLPLLVEFSKKYKTIGFDINKQRISELSEGFDRTREVDKETLLACSSSLKFTHLLEEIIDCNFYIITVPTPIDIHKQPDLSPLFSASELVGKVLAKGDIVIYESTVYPGCTENDCVPILERVSGLKFNQDFFCGYSPERINPGDKTHTLTKIKKVTSGSNPETAQKVNQLYGSIISAGTHLAESIMVAEAAKVIENSQRDINIAFVNELSMIFNKMGINTQAVLEAAATKWNFLPFKPGLVGGHCIGVDPFYLTHKAQELGYHPEIILAGRRLNDSMGAYIASQTIKLMIGKGHKIEGANVLILGITFKENCPDIRNSKVIDIINELKQFGTNINIYDQWADKAEVMHEYGVELTDAIAAKKYQAVILAVAHKNLLDIDFASFKMEGAVIFDVKSVLDINVSDGRL